MLNGHIHQIAAEGRREHDLPHRPLDRLPPARPGQAPAPGPLKNVPAGKLRTMLGLTSVSYREGRAALAVIDSALQ